MKLLVPGATGRTGSQLVTQALAADYEVRALVRNPQKLEADSSTIEVVVGDATDTAAVGQALKGSDLASRVARTFVPAMRDAGVGRVIVLSASGSSAIRPKPTRSGDRAVATGPSSTP